jgi:hypothetical protein
MKSFKTMSLSIALSAALVSAASAKSIDAMRWHRRVLLVTSSDGHGQKAELQKSILATWKRQADDRDLSLVEIAGTQVTGASDAAMSLRQRYNLSSGGFEALLIGKDGHVALRSAGPISADTLQGTIDAMPMRKAGER